MQRLCLLCLYICEMASYQGLLETFPEIFVGPVLNLDWLKAFIVCSHYGKNHFVKVTDTSGNLFLKLLFLFVRMTLIDEELFAVTHVSPGIKFSYPDPMQG